MRKHAVWFILGVLLFVGVSLIVHAQDIPIQGGNGSVNGSTPAGGGINSLNAITYGAFGDGASHPLTAQQATTLNNKFGTYGLACVAGDENDWAVIQGILYQGSAKGNSVYIPYGTYYTNQPLTLNWTSSPITGQPAAPKIGLIYGDGKGSVIFGKISSSGRAVLELLGTDNANAVNCEMVNFTCQMQTTGSNAAYCLRVGDANDSFRARRVWCLGANGLRLKIASSSTYAEINTRFEQCQFYSNYNNSWFAAGSSTNYSLNVETGGASWDNVHFSNCTFIGHAETRAWECTFENCMFDVNQNNPTSGGINFNECIDVRLGSVTFLACYFEDFNIAIVAAPRLGDVGGITVRDCHFSGLNNFAGPAPTTAIDVFSVPASGKIGPVVINGCRFRPTQAPYSSGYAIQLTGITGSVTDCTNLDDPNAALPVQYVNCRVFQTNQTVDGSGNPTQNSLLNDSIGFNTGLGSTFSHIISPTDQDLKIMGSNNASNGVTIGSLNANGFVVFKPGNVATADFAPGGYLGFSTGAPAGNATIYGSSDHSLWLNSTNNQNLILTTGTGAIDIGLVTTQTLSFFGATAQANQLAMPASSNVSWGNDTFVSRNAAGVVQAGATASQSSGSFVATNFECIDTGSFFFIHSGSSDTYMSRGFAGGVYFGTTQGGTDGAFLATKGYLVNNGVFIYLDSNGATNTGTSRTGTAEISAGNGTTGDKSGTFLAANFKVNSAGGTPTINSGNNSPESAVTAPVGSLFLRTNGGASTTLYVKESGAGNTGWVAK